MREYRFSYIGGRADSFHVYLLAFIWTFGLSGGILFSLKAEPLFTSRMCAGVLTSVSIPGLLLLMIFPFILSLFAIRFRAMWAVFILALLKSFIYGFSRCMIIHIYFRAGWLVNILLFFSDTAISLLLLWYWISCLAHAGKWTLKTCFGLCAGAVLICVLDCCFVLPVLTGIMA